MDDQHTKTWCCILETSNEWMTKKCTKNENWVYYKHPTHGYDQHDDQPTYPKLRPCTRNIQLMDDWHIQKDKKIHSPVTHMSRTWLCWMNSSIEWCPTSDMISAKNCTKNKEKLFHDKRFCQSSLNLLKMRNNLSVGNYSCRVQTLHSVYASC
jgi:hypothetical protein